MDRITVLVTLISLYSSCCHGSILGLPYGFPHQTCENVTINIASTMFVTQTEVLPPFVNTRVIEPDTSFKLGPQHTSTTTTILTTVPPPHNITIYKHADDCVTPLPPLTVTQTIPMFTTQVLPPITITKSSKMLVWMTVPPVTTTVLVTTTAQENPKLKISVKTQLHDTTIGPDTVEMTLPITFTELLAPMTSIVTDHSTHTTTLPAATIQIAPETIIKPPETVTSTIIISHTEVIPADTKIITWTITQVVNTKCNIEYVYNTPVVPFPAGTQQIQTSALPQNLFNVLN